MFLEALHEEAIRLCFQVYYRACAVDACICITELSDEGCLCECASVWDGGCGGGGRVLMAKMGLG